MSEIQTTDWDETAANNNQTPPAGWPEGQAPSTVNDCAREMMAQIKRWFNRLTGRTDAGALVASAGTSTAITVAYDTAPASLYTGLECSFKVTTTCGVDPTLNVNSLGAKNIQKFVGSYVNLEAGDIVATQHVKVKYDGTLDRWILMVAGGGSAAHGKASFSAHKNGSAQGSITSATNIKLTFGTEDWDTGGYFASSTWTPPAGKYQISGAAAFTNANGVDNELMTIMVFKNGAVHKAAYYDRGSTGTIGTHISCIVSANGTDTFELYVNKGGAGDGTVAGGASDTWFQGVAV
jgi:hypothetical protein